MSIETDSQKIEAMLAPHLRRIRRPADAAVWAIRITDGEAQLLPRAELVSALLAADLPGPARELANARRRPGAIAIWCVSDTETGLAWLPLFGGRR